MKIKLLKKLSLATFASVVLASALAFAAPSNHQTTNRAGGDIGSGEGDLSEASEPFNHRDLLAYCPRALAELIRNINFSMNPNLSFNRKRALVVEGFRSALKKYATWNNDLNPLTREALRRGLAFNEFFNSSCAMYSPGTALQTCLQNTDRNSYRLLLVFANHVINRIGPLDQYYYIPFKAHLDCEFANCNRDEWMDSFWSHYKDAAVYILQLYAGEDSRSGLPESFGHARTELRAAANILSWAGDDLANDEFRRRYACTYVDLKSAAHDLKMFLRGNVDKFGPGPEGERFAVDYARMTVNQALDSLNENECRVYRRQRNVYDLPHVLENRFIERKR